MIVSNLPQDRRSGLTSHLVPEWVEPQQPSRLTILGKMRNNDQEVLVYRPPTSGVDVRVIGHKSSEGHAAARRMQRPSLCGCM